MRITQHHLKQAATATLLLLVATGVQASTNGSLPWEGGLKTLADSITGPVAAILSLLSIVGAGGGLLFGGEMNTFIKTMAYLVLVIGMVVGAANLMSAFFNVSGAVI